MQRLACLAVTVLVLASLAPAMGPATVDDETHAIKLVRAPRVGFRASVKGKASGHRKVVMITDGAESPVEDERRSVELEAVEHVTAVGEKGKLDRMECTIRRCRAMSGGSEWSLAEGTKLTLRRDEAMETVFEIGDERLAESRREVLGMMLGLETGTGVDDDAIFGSRTPRKVGESWSIDRAAAARELTEEMGDGVFVIAPQDISGTVTLVAVEAYEGERCLRIKAEMRIDGMTLGAGAPPGAELKRGLITIELESLYPLRTELPLLKSRIRLSAELQMITPEMPNQPSMNVRFTDEQKQERAVTLIR